MIKNTIRTYEEIRRKHRRYKPITINFRSLQQTRPPYGGRLNQQWNTSCCRAICDDASGILPCVHPISRQPETGRRRKSEASNRTGSHHSIRRTMEPGRSRNERGCQPVTSRGPLHTRLDRMGTGDRRVPPRGSRVLLLLTSRPSGSALQGQAYASMRNGTRVSSSRPTRYSHTPGGTVA
jgi:hypothetical protein